MRLENKLVLSVFGLASLYIIASIFLPPTGAGSIKTDIEIQNVTFAIFGYIISGFVNRKMLNKNQADINKETEQQMWVVFIICVVSLGILAGIKYLSLDTSRTLLDLALVEHIFSGSAGFLIGQQKLTKKN